jgi:hypothetical protein
MPHGYIYVGWSYETHALQLEPVRDGDFISLSRQDFSSPLHRLVWFTFATLSWSLWNIKNKLTIEGKPIGNQVGAFFHMLIHMQS